MSLKRREEEGGGWRIPNFSAWFKPRVAEPVIPPSVRSAPAPLGSTPRGNMQSVMQGQNPLLLNEKELGLVVKRLGPDFRNKSTEIHGAQLADQYPHADPVQLIKILANEKNLPLPSIKQLTNKEATLSGIVGSYNPFKHEVELSVLEPSIGTMRKGLYQKGVAGHEGAHMQQEFGAHPNTWDFVARGERIPINGKNSNIEKAGIGFGDLIQLEKMVPGSVDRNMLLNFSKLTDAQKAQAIGNAYRVASGNIKDQMSSGFIGSNPYAARGMESLGHFRKPYTQELDIPIHRLAREAAKRGEEIDPTWIRRFEDVNQLYEGYSPGVRLSGQNFDPKLYSKATPNPWTAMGLTTAAGLGLTTAGIALKEQQDRLDRERAMKKSIEKVTTKYGPAF